MVPNSQPHSLLTTTLSYLLPLGLQNNIFGELPNAMDTCWLTPILTDDFLSFICRLRFS